jgi:ABC-type polysaccharide/polyol phosphate export permease
MTGPSATASHEAGPGPILLLDGTRPRPAAWLREVASFGPVLVALARKEFKTRYKGAALGVLWSVAIPLLQAAVLAFVFSRVVRVGVDVDSYGAYVLSGMLGWSYFATSLLPATTSIVDGASLTDKVWFPRILLVLTGPLANLVGLGVTHVMLIGLLPILGVDIGLRLLLLPLAILLLIAFTISVSAVLAAMHVYFRDTRYLVQAVLMVWIYLTPIIYQAELLGRWAPWLEANPMTGIVTLSRLATVGADDWVRPVTVSVVATLALTVLAVEIHRRHDRCFVDLL